MKNTFLLCFIVALVACNGKKPSTAAADAKETATKAVEAVPSATTSAATNVATTVATTASAATEKAKEVATSTVDKAKMAAADVKKALKSDTLCYEFHLKKDVNAVQLIISGDNVTGEMNYLPYEKDSARGSLKGKKKGNEIVADWKATIEGSTQVEEVRFKIEDNKLLRAGGALAERGGKLVLKDPAKAKYSESFSKVSCKVKTEKKK